MMSGSQITARNPLFCFALLCALALFSWSPNALAVDCSAANITLENQTDVANFQTDYGPCDTVTGSLSITETTPGSITDLSPLSDLIAVNVNFFILNNTALTTASLPNLATIGEDAQISGNDQLTSLSMNALTSVGINFIISNNPMLTNLDGLSMLGSVGAHFFINNNAALTQMNGLSNLTSVGSTLQIRDHASLTSIGLSGLLSVGSDLEIRANAILTSLSGLSALQSIGTLLIVYDHPALQTLGLNSLTSIGGGITISGNSSLSSIASLSQVSDFTGLLNIDNNDALTAIDLDALTTVGANVYIGNNDTLSSIDGLSALVSVGTDLVLTNNPLLMACDPLSTLLDDVDDALPGPGPGTSGIPDLGDELTIDSNGLGCNSADQVTGAPVRFNVDVFVSDGNPADVEVAFSCNQGQPHNGVASLGHGEVMQFVVDHISQGEPRCEIIVSSPLAGYENFFYYPDYNPGQSCLFENVVSDTYGCFVYVSLKEVPWTITKVWDFAEDIPEYGSKVRVDAYCENMRLGPEGSLGNDSAAGYLYLGSDTMMPAPVYPNFEQPYTRCRAIETVYDSAMESDQGCADWQTVLPDGSIECTITNTVFYEGIPTLNRVGLLLLIVMMLGLGAVGMRRIT